MNVPEGLKYSSDHEWVRLEGDVATVGITDYAQDALGDVVFVDVPTTGTAVEAGSSFSEIESTKSVSDIYSPLTGEIVAVNDLLDANPEMVNTDPYGEGWLCRISLSAPEEVESLLDATAYQALIEG